MSPLARFSIAVVLFILLVCTGTAGYTLIEGWPLADSLYMTFITVSTVGFGEVQPLSPAGKRFTVFFLLFSIGTVGYSVTTLFSYVFEGVLVRAVKERRMQWSIRRLKNHYIICGCGDVGREVAYEFQRSRVRFLVIDLNPEQSELARDQSFLFLKGDAVDDEVLIEANIGQARGLVSALPDDESNLFVVLTARQLNPGLTIVSQAEEERTVRKLLKAGANRVISPNQIAGRRMASVLLRPSVIDFLDVVVKGEEMAMRIEEVQVGADSPLVGKTLRESGIGQRTGAIIVGIHGQKGKTRINPASTVSLSAVKLNPGDVLIAMGSEEHLNRLRSFVGAQARHQG
ncbi:MAG: potassium channel family protein [Spirochaetota bacterium]